VAVGLLVIAVYFPHVKRVSNSVLFFEDIRHMEWTEFAWRSAHVSEAEVEEDLLRQIHVSSWLASRKLHQLRWAYGLSAVGLGAWLALMAWATVG
jgi:hypothetical protein